MTPLAINLLPRKGTREILAKRFLVRLKRGSFIVLGSYAIILLVVFGWRLIVGQQVLRLEREVQQAKAAVDALSGVESQQVLIKQKLQLSNKILSEQKQWYQLMRDVIEFTPAELAVSEVNLGRDGSFRISVTTARLQELVVMLNALLELGLQRDFVESVVLESVEKSAIGEYGFSLVFKT